jgi:hypothetical protein
VDENADVPVEPQSEEAVVTEETPATPAAPEVDVDRLSKRLVRPTPTSAALADHLANRPEASKPSIQACQDDGNDTIDQEG